MKLKWKIPSTVKLRDFPPSQLFTKQELFQPQLRAIWEQLMRCFSILNVKLHFKRMAGRQKGEHDSCGWGSYRDPVLLQPPLDNGITLCPSSGQDPETAWWAKSFQHHGLDGTGTLTVIQCLEKELPLPVSFSPRGASFPRHVKKTRGSWGSHLLSGAAEKHRGPTLRLFWCLLRQRNTQDVLKVVTAPREISDKQEETSIATNR